MKFIYFLAYIAGNAFFTILTRKSLRLLMPKCKVSSSIEFFCYSLFFTMSSVLPFFTEQFVVSLAEEFIALTALSFLYKDSFAKKYFAVLALFLYTNFVHYGLVYISGQGNFLFFNTDKINSVIGIALECILFYIFFYCLAIVHYILKENIFIMMSSAAAVILSLCLIFLLCISLLYAKKDYDSFYLPMIILLVIIDLLFLCLHGFKLLRTKIALVSYQNKYYRSQLDMIQTSEAKAASLRHDLKNHLMVLSDFISKEELARAKEYLSSINAELHPEHAVSSTGNAVVDSLLNYKLQEINSMKIHLDYIPEIPAELNIDSFDLTVILGNLIDNALEAFQHQTDAETKALRILLKYECGKLSIKISNTFDGQLHIFKNRILTRKKDAAIHGIGLSNVSAAVSKYHGQLKIVPSDKMFTVCAVLFEPNEETD